ncbi:hypothetical protein TRVL_03636 [Trypanosoma vivax]|nr:hypothetical protein TRVL_03636 [Trypanosoma vivax]
MQQKVLIASPVSLFEVVDGNAVDRGNCACAIVTAAPGGSLKYSLVCYNERRETLCVAHLTADIAQTIQFQVNAETHANFRDSSERRWNCVFPTPDKLRAFLAALGTAAYALAGQPTHSVYTVDFSPLTGGLVVQQQHRVRVRYWTYGLRGSEPLMLGELLETSGEELYTFRPALSSAALLQQDNSDFLHLVRGFECGIVGTFENSLRAIVLPPQAVPLSRQKSYGTSGAAFVVQVVSILQDDISAGADGAVPTVFSSDDYHTSAGSGAGEASNTGIIVLHPEGTSAVGERDVTSQQTALQAPDLVEAGGGVPTAHMALLQKLGVHLSSATSCAIDVRSITGTAVDVWRQTVDRPKPSRLTNEALQQAVQQLILENERVANGLVEKDELLRALDRRNRELQQRVDAAALSSQQLLDEKNDTVRMASDMRLEKERGIMQVQQQINQVDLDRDDTQRHLLTVKQLLTASEEQLHKLRSDANMQNEKAESVAVSLGHIQDALAEERSRRKALEATAETIQQQISATQIDFQVKNSQLDDIRRAVDNQRTHYAQIIEMERQRRLNEVEQLRSDFVKELQQQEEKFMADRARVSEENFRRGHAEGRAIGKLDGEAVASERRQQLTLEAQRLTAEINARQAELRQATDDGMTVIRSGSVRSARLKAQLHEENFRRGRLELALNTTRGRLEGGRDSVIHTFLSAARRLWRPTDASDLLTILDCQRRRQPIDFSFQEKAYEAEAIEIVRRRCEWIEATLLSLYKGKLEEALEEWMKSLIAQQESTEEAVRQLMLERDGAEHCELSLDERRARYTITREMESFFADLAAFLLEQQTSRDRLLSDVESALAVMLDEYAKYITDLRAWRVHEMEERQHLRVECARAYVDLLTMEEMAFRSLEAAKVAGALAVDQGNLVAEEEGDRISIDSEQGAEWSSLCSAHDIAMTSLVRSAAIVKDQQSIINEEEEARVRLLEEEAEEVGIAMKELDEVLLPAKEPSLPSPPPVEEAADAGQPIEDVEKLEGDSSTSVSDTLEEEKGEEVVEVAPVVKAEVEDEDEDGDEDEDEDESSEEDSEEQEQRKVVRRPMEVPPPPIQEAQAKTEVSRKKKLFDSSSDEEGPSAPLRSAAPPPPPPAARSRMPPSRTALPDLSDYSD